MYMHDLSTGLSTNAKLSVDDTFLLYQSMLYLYICNLFKLCFEPKKQLAVPVEDKFQS